jgi:hypothetical protein
LEFWSPIGETNYRLRSLARFFQGLTHSPRFFAHPGADFYTLYTKHIRDLREEISGVDGTWKIYENYSGWWFEPS